MAENHRTRVGLQRRQKMQARLVESALAVFAEKGVDASVIDDVIATAGVSRGTFYNYFKTNTELVVTVGEQLSNEIIEMIESVVGDYENPVQRLACGLRQFLITAQQYPILARFLWRAGFNAYSSNNLIMVYIPRHIQEAIEQDSFNVQDTLFALDFLTGVMLSSMFAITSRPLQKSYSDQVVKHLLLGLGVPETEAETLVGLDMPTFLLPEDALIIRASEKYTEQFSHA